MSIVMFILDMFMLLRFYPFIRIWRFYVLMYLDFMTCILEMYVIYPLRSCLNFYACYIFGELLET